MRGRVGSFAPAASRLRSTPSPTRFAGHLSPGRRGRGVRGCRVAPLSSSPLRGEAVRGWTLVVTPFWTACESSPIEGQVKGVARPAMSTSIATMRFSACLLSSIASLLMPFSFHREGVCGRGKRAWIEWGGFLLTDGDIIPGFGHPYPSSVSAPRRRSTFSHKGRRQGARHRRPCQPPAFTIGGTAAAGDPFSPCGRRWPNESEVG